MKVEPYNMDNKSQQILRASLVAQLVKNLPAMQETWVQSLGWEDPLEKEKVTLPAPVFWPGKLVTKSRI